MVGLQQLRDIFRGAGRNAILQPFDQHLCTRSVLAVGALNGLDQERSGAKPRLEELSSCLLAFGKGRMAQLANELLAFLRRQWVTSVSPRRQNGKDYDPDHYL